jgi:hypothetical protein
MLILDLILVRQKPVLWVGLAAAVGLSAPGVKRAYGNKPSEIPTLSTVARLGFENVILSNAARTPVFALSPVNT